MTQWLLVDVLGAIKVHWIWIFFLIGLIVGFLIAVFFARFGAGKSFLDALFRGMSALFQSPPGISRALSVWRENRQRRKLQTAAVAREIAALEDEIGELREQIGERRRKIREARWRVEKP